MAKKKTTALNSPEKKIKRKSTRFKPDPGTLIELSFNAKAKKTAKEHVGLVLSESAHGCSGVFAGVPRLKKKDIVTITVGHLDTLRAEVRWVIVLDEQIQKAGFLYLD